MFVAQQTSHTRETLIARSETADRPAPAATFHAAFHDCGRYYK
jgi:hypothetical protein